MAATVTFTPDQIEDVEKLCQTLAAFPEHKRQIVTASVLGYVNGIEAGIATERAERAKKEA